MKTTLIAVLNLFFCLRAYSQTIEPSKILKDVQNAQSLLKTASYSIERIDTLVTNETRILSGKVIVETDKEDTLLGFKFWAKESNEKSERVYDGHIGYEITSGTKTYQVLNSPIDLDNILLGGGGRIILPGLVKIDTSGAREIQFSEDYKYYYLTIFYPDLTKYDVINRRRIITLDKPTMLPVAVRQHQENYGKVQDLYFRITKMQINEPIPYDFSSPAFLKDYTHITPVSAKDPRQELKGKTAPGFSLSSFDGKVISTADFKGKVVLLDFWEVWCGPCIAGMPKVQTLYEKYKRKGLLVYGVVNDLRNLNATKEFVRKRSINLPVLIGNEQLKKDYKLDGSVPLYIVINKKGEIALVRFGLNGDIESLIEQELE